MSAYEIFQLEKYGNILPEWNDGTWPTETVEPEDQQERISNAEIAYIFNNENSIK